MRSIRNAASVRFRLPAPLENPPQSDTRQLGEHARLRYGEAGEGVLFALVDVP
jgi:hypothetical protein